MTSFRLGTTIHTTGHQRITLDSVFFLWQGTKKNLKNTPGKLRNVDPKMGLCSIGNTSEPTIDFQGMFASFPGSTFQYTNWFIGIFIYWLIVIPI